MEEDKPAPAEMFATDNEVDDAVHEKEAEDAVQENEEEDVTTSEEGKPSSVEVFVQESEVEDVMVDVSEEELPGDETTEFHKPIKVEEGQQSHEEKRYNIFERQAMRVARSPCTYFWVSFVSALGLGVLGMVVGNFSVAADNNGWNSRGTLIADRHTQFMLIEQNSYDLWSDTTGAKWNDLIENVQPGWESSEDDDNSRRRLEEPYLSSRPGFDDISSLGHRFQRALQMHPMKAMEEAHDFRQSSVERSRFSERAKSATRRLNEDQIRLLNALNSTEGTLLEGCDVSWYSSTTMFDETRLWPVWRTKAASASFFDSGLIQELCLEEQGTQNLLEKEGLCQTCGDSTKCLQPYSPVFYARLTVEDGMILSCESLAMAWKDEGHEEAHKRSLQQCVDDLLKNYNIDRDGMELPDSCPFGFFPSILDEKYPSTEVAEYSSTIFATKDDDETIEKMYDIVDSFPNGQVYVSGAYDTQWEDFVELSLDEQLIIDMSLACGSAIVTFLAMMVHTRSPFLSFVGLAQITFSFPLAYFFYTFIARLEFFPFLNFIGIFVIFALGADDVFVAVDKWKNARLKNPDASVQEVAAIAMPDAAMAMLLTTITTAVAFFGTAVCPVAPILCFAVFCGLLVILDYILCILLVFPALCIYDQAENRDKRCCCHCNWVPQCKCCAEKSEVTEKSDLGLEESAGEFEESEENVAPDEAQVVKSAVGHNEPEFDESLIHRILRGFYKYLHMVRWPLLVICAAALVACAIKAAQIELPTSSDVRLYDEEDNQYEQNFVWRKKLLFKVLEAQGGSSAYVIWGVTPGDNGDLNNPETWSSLLLDESFNPAETKAQEYLRDYCGRFFAEDFAAKTSQDFECPINRFDTWVQEQYAASEKNQIYIDHCNFAEKLPMEEDKFDGCFYNWGQLVRETTVLAREGKITSMYFAFNSRVRYDSPFSDLADEWKLIEDWMDEDQSTAPSTAKNAYFTSEDFWWYSTNESMLDTAFQSAGIAMGAAAAVILFSSRSVVLTLFSTVTVGFVLTSVTAMLVALGWQLGFLESILFAILIGISCDFVIHFSHAYSHLKGHKNRGERTLFALLSMGPSVLAAGFTTFAAACVMLATVITFFEKFAVVLFLTVLQALVGSFVVFLTMTDCIGPADPTFLVDRMSRCGRNPRVDGE